MVWEKTQQERREGKRKERCDFISSAQTPKFRKQTKNRKRFSGKLLAQLKTECHELLNLDESDAIERHVTAVVTSRTFRIL